MTQRRYSEAEVEAIFQRATEDRGSAQRQVASAEGMTLAELESIGSEVGIMPAVIRQAAHAIDAVGVQSARTFLGMPIGVGRTIELERKLTDDEWERLVVDLRETFDARGTVRHEGSLRTWSNGNLQALLEPTAAGGQRLRLRTVKGEARAMIGAGLGVFGAGFVMLAAAAISGATGDTGRLVASAFLATTGLVMAGSSLLRLPRWAKLRRQQMEEVAARLTSGDASR